jgi:hypothetical protein
MCEIYGVIGNCSVNRSYSRLDNVEVSSPEVRRISTELSLFSEDVPQIPHKTLSWTGRIKYGYENGTRELAWARLWREQPSYP